MGTRVDTELVRFRVNSDLKMQAEAVCQAHGLDFNDVLRTLIRRIAIERSIPFDQNAPAHVSKTERQPFDTYGAFLTQDLAHLEAESVISMLSLYVAKCAGKIAREKRKRLPKAELVSKWSAQAREAMALRRTINTNDQEHLGKVTKRYTALLATVD